LFEKKILDQQSLDLQQSTTAQLEALVKADEAAVASAKVQLEFTKIVSPIDGRVGLRLVDQGNIVHANDQAGLACIAHKSLEIFERCRLWQQNSPATPDNSAAFSERTISNSSF
jgi:multidrug efflux pump subunit AcrA (membrane-fusion protein)